MTPGMVRTVIAGRAPTVWLNSNTMRRWNHWKVAAEVKEWRNAGAIYCRQAMLHRAKPVGLAVVLLRIGTNRPNQRRDPMNWYPTVKALVDGFTDAELWPDDDAKRVAIVQPEFTTVLAPDEWQAVITWEEPT